ncbi:MAG: hypothetical protein ACRD2W_12865 [Acidimicrobiales bacterium]
MSDEHQGGHGGGHGGPLSNDLPPKPPPWRFEFKGFRNTYFEDRLDWTPIKRDPLGEPDEETRLIAEALARRTQAERAARARY